jgi:hypothetical protein
MPVKRVIPVHFTRGGRRVRCGLVAKRTVIDTRQKSRVTCKNCLRALKAESRP